MWTESMIRNVFAHFQNLNLLVLINGLRRRNVAKGDWTQLDRLCPIAHGLPEGRLVQETRYVSQANSLEQGCVYAARRLGAQPDEVARFVQWWDSADETGLELLIVQLQRLWQERLADADAMQRILEQPESRGVTPTAARDPSAAAW